MVAVAILSCSSLARSTAYYAKVLEDNWDSYVTNTLLEAVGVEVFGHAFR